MTVTMSFLLNLSSFLPHSFADSCQISPKAGVELSNSADSVIVNKTADMRVFFFKPLWKNRKVCEYISFAKNK